MKLELKQYQQRTLDVVKAFFELTQTQSPKDAYEQVTADVDITTRLGALRRYVPNADSPDTPQVMIKIPTGGGKTILATQAIKVIATACNVEYPFVLWFTPSETIREQTAEALKKATHPYRQALDAAFGGNVKVFGIDEKFQITPEDISDNVCVVVTTAQAFRHEQKQQNKYNVYRNNENLEPHFADVSLEPGMDPREDDPGKPKCSFANLVIRHHPIMIVDEAHTMLSNLSKETVSQLQPSAVFEMTATPGASSNILYSVRASELYDEEMVKLPIELADCGTNRDEAILSAVGKREELEKAVREEVQRGEGAFFRPLVLFQATPKNGEMPCEELKKFLVEKAGAQENEIAVVTGEQKELDGIDVRDVNCPLKYVITVEALKEGWDCPSAYVLCSVANVHSNTDTVQLLGRVMRQPDAKRRKTDALNKAYAIVVSRAFGTAVEELVVGLREKGFDRDCIVQRPVAMQTTFYEPGEADAVTLSDAEWQTVEAMLPRGIVATPALSGGVKLEVSAKLTNQTVSAVAQALATAGLETKARELVAKVTVKRQLLAETAPSANATMKFPRLGARVQGTMVFDSATAFAELDERIETRLPAALRDDEFQIVNDGQRFEIYLKGNQITSKSMRNDRQMYLAGFSGAIGEAELVNALDAATACEHLSQAAKRGWIVEIVHDLVQVKKYKSGDLYCQRFRLKSVLEMKLEEAYRRAVEQTYQSVFGGMDATHPLSLDLASGFVFDKDLYKNERVLMTFHAGGTYEFTKHFLGPNLVPAFDGQGANGEGEEYQCAKIIDAHPKVKYWLRNAARRTGSFRLPLAHDWFYPDFVGELVDGRLFVVEYKGQHLKSTTDTLAKDAIGKLWAKQDPGRYLYRTVYKQDETRDTKAQVDMLFDDKKGE